MRYRRLSQRYALLLTTGQPRPFGEMLRVEQMRVVLAQPRWRPETDIYETGTAMVVTVDLAGVDPDGLDVTIFQDALVIAGGRSLPAHDAEGVYHSAEIRQGPFRLELALPAPTDGERVEAHYDRGLLQIVIAKANGR